MRELLYMRDDAHTLRQKAVMEEEHRSLFTVRTLSAACDLAFNICCGLSDLCTPKGFLFVTGLLPKALFHYMAVGLTVREKDHVSSQ